VTEERNWFMDRLLSPKGGFENRYREHATFIKENSLTGVIRLDFPPANTPPTPIDHFRIPESSPFKQSVP
jgi:hypothetical protein